MMSYDDLIDLVRRLTEQNTQLIEENRRLKDRLDIALNTIERVAKRRGSAVEGRDCCAQGAEAFVQKFLQAR